MFVQSNTVRAIRAYYKERLGDLFSESEIRQILGRVLQIRLGLEPSQLLLSDEVRLSESDLLYFRSVVKRLQTHEPVQYVLGSTFFADLLIRCDKRALIPRPETEELVYWITENASKEASLRILDLCTGTGCIALALKDQLPKAEVHALDLSSEALDLARENSRELGLEIALQQLDVLENPAEWPLEKNSFDLWISNPPYIPEREKAAMHTNVLDFEPEMALFVGDEDPLVFYRSIAVSAMEFLKPGGKLFFEMNENLAEETRQLVAETGFSNLEIKSDLQGKKRMLKAEKH